MANISSELDIPPASVHKILTKDLQMKKIMAKWVPHLLDERQHEQRCEAAYRNLQLLSQHPRLLRQTLALDETWVVLYRPFERDQRRFWLCTGEEPPQVPKQKMHERKRMLLVAMEFDGIAYYHLYEEGETVNAERYRDFLSKIIPDFRTRKNIQNVMLLHDNARPHKARLVSQFLLENNISSWDHPPYSPDISPPDFNFFGPMKRHLGGKRYSSWSEFVEALEEEIRNGNDSGFYQGVRDLESRWKSVIEKDGVYL